MIAWDKGAQRTAPARAAGSNNKACRTIALSGLDHRVALALLAKAHIRAKGMA